jgi:ribulose kinase
MIQDVIAKMTCPPLKVYHPDAEAMPVYDQLYAIYRHAHDHFGRENPGIMRQLKEIRREQCGSRPV